MPTQDCTACNYSTSDDSKAARHESETGHVMEDEREDQTA